MELSPKALNQMNWPRNVQGPISSLPKSNETAESDSTDERLLVQPGTIGCVHGCIRRGLARHRLKLAIHKEGKVCHPFIFFEIPPYPQADVSMRTRDAEIALPAGFVIGWELYFRS